MRNQPAHNRPTNQLTITRADLALALVRQIGLSKSQSIRLVSQIMLIMTERLIRGEAVKISSFGVWQVRSKAPRIGCNPRTGEAVPIKARRVVTFRASASLKNKVDCQAGQASR
ncbi:MAG: integration host factor subunit alpha [Pseudomonadota bacterium]